MSDAANLDKLGREPGTGLTPDKKEARVDRKTGSDASAALAALGGGPALQSTNRAASQSNSSPAKSSARVKA
jgi:hypothetical protein|tara:strand:+ start:799 stop:1014 length:216 start_codon:yes stop_codon:yes gene_type:complete